MSKTFDIDMYDGHLIFIVDGMKVLVDTGSPVTIGGRNPFKFMEEEYGCHATFMGKDINGISQLMNYDIDVLMGMDIIERYYVQTDYKHRQITFSKEPLPVEQMSSTSLIRGHMGEVCINLTVKDNTIKLALDTGAKISYIDNSYTEEENWIGIKDDFNPMIGHFKTPIYAMEVSIGDIHFPVNFGVLPPLLGMPLQMMGIYGVIGFDLFNAFTVVMDFIENKLYIR